MNGETLDPRAALDRALAEADEASRSGDAAKASAMYEVAADIASRLSLIAGEEAPPGEETPDLLGDEGPAGLLEGVASRMTAGEEARDSRRSPPSALVWKAAERDMRVFFFRNLPEVFDLFREKYDTAKQEDRWEEQWQAFKALADMMILLSRLKVPKKML